MKRLPAVGMTANMDNQKPDISIIIRTKNEESLIDQTLSAIFEQEIDVLLEVIVVDSGSTDRTLDIVRRYPARFYEIEARDFSYGRALNYGAVRAEGDYLINLSAHCIPANSVWMARLLNPLLRNPNLAATYGKQIPIKGLNPFEERQLIAAFTANEAGAVKTPFSNSNCAIRKAVWATYPFDEQASFAEDFIWSQCLPAEHPIQYVSDAMVYHTHPLNFRYWAKRCYENGLFTKYLEHVYGFQYPWIDQQLDGSQAVSDTFMSAVRNYAVECFHLMQFLSKNRYFGVVPVLPVYVMLERYYYEKGVSEGKRLYGSYEKKTG